MFSDGGNKQKRRDSVMAKYHVVLQLGDDLNDFAGYFYNKSYHERMHIADSLQKHFGVDFISLPNPMYGGWQTGLYTDYKTTNQDSVRHILLKGYK
jgi:5'-nucleotidase (lipoprotein e(P4) family)